MQNAGMVPLVDFEDLPVSGFGDVLPKYLKLRHHFNVLKRALVSPDCLGLISVDYPGFNMKLVALAKELHKPILYVAPPQIWAWKSHRARIFAGCPNIRLAVFFDFEKFAYEKAECNVVRMEHPFVKAVSTGSRNRCKRVLLLPGSRKRQALRNLSVFLETATHLMALPEFGESDFIILAARTALVESLQKKASSLLKNVNRRIHVEATPQDAAKRYELYSSAQVAISAPGTATLELALSNCSTVVCTKPDFLTLTLAKRSVKTSYFALPNIILQRQIFPEFILESEDGDSVRKISETVRNMAACPPPFSCDNNVLLQRLQPETAPPQLMSEFLAQLFQGNPH